MNVHKVDNFLKHIKNPEIIAVHTIQNVLLRELQNYAFNNGFKQLMPLLMSPITDPLNHEVYPAEIRYENTPLKLTASMIFHKQLALIPNAMEKILIMAPNIRLELAKKKSSENHLLEFSQYDIEIKNADMNEVMDYLEGLYVHTFSEIERQCNKELKVLGRTLPKLNGAFPRYSTENIPWEKVDVFCHEISTKEKIPCFITSFKREFYDKEDPSKPGTYRNFDLVYTEGYGEALSGAEREYEYDSIMRRMKELDMNLEPFANYLEVAKRGLLPRSAGAGIGIQRLLKFICGKKAIRDVCLFDRSILTDFAF
ncbi:MAG: asparagine synthetase A [Rickettsia endosymbiont of Ixodes persulcatus]|nr:asparagine synthetase A [Rickettsia endosymbiont of Ixodes persulcatus]